MSDKKKKIAAIAAVANYIKSEQEAIAFSVPGSSLSARNYRNERTNVAGFKFMGHQRPAAADADAIDDVDESISQIAFN